MFLFYKLDKLLEGRVGMLTDMSSDSRFDALAEAASGARIERNHFLKPQATFRTDSALDPT